MYHFSCLNFLDKAWWFLSLRVFGLLSSSLLFFPQHFGWYVFRPSSGVCRTQEPSWNFELHPLLNSQGSPVLIPLAITGTSVKYSYIVTRLQSGLNLKKAEGHITQNVVEITIKMKTIVWKPLMIKKHVILLFKLIPKTKTKTENNLTFPLRKQVQTVCLDLQFSLLHFTLLSLQLKTGSLQEQEEMSMYPAFPPKVVFDLQGAIFYLSALPSGNI